MFILKSLSLHWLNMPVYLLEYRVGDRIIIFHACICRRHASFVVTLLQRAGVPAKGMGGCPESYVSLYRSKALREETYIVLLTPREGHTAFHIFFILPSFQAYFSFFFFFFSSGDDIGIVLFLCFRGWEIVFRFSSPSTSTTMFYLFFSSSYLT